MLLQSAPPKQTILIDRGYQRAKRVFDVVFTLLILLPLCIVIAIIAVLIWLDSGGPIFFRQKRVGQNGVEFDMIKFRSMYQNCADELHRKAIEQFMANQAINKPDTSDLQYKLVEDPRITRVGRIIRKASIDELPQFFNVLRGEMSLVGPRPPLSYEVELYQPKDHLRFCGKPGLTGLWQVYGRGSVPFDTMIDMDIDYLQQQSLWLDFKLVALTIPVMLSGRGGA